MLAVGMLLIWSGYDITFWGYCLLRGYDVTLGQLSTPLHPYAGPWPPPLIPDSQIFPGGIRAAGGPPAGIASPPLASEAAGSNFVNSVLHKFKGGTTQQPGTTTAGGRG